VNFSRKAIRGTPLVKIKDFGLEKFFNGIKFRWAKSDPTRVEWIFLE